MASKTIIVSAELLAELDAATAAGLYENEETFLTDAIRTLLAARPDLREAIACKLYERGFFSLGKAAEWSGLSIEALKAALHRRRIVREAPESVDEITAMATANLRLVGRSSH